MARFESIVLCIGFAVMPASCASSPPPEPAPVVAVQSVASSQDPVLFRCEAEVHALGEVVIGEAQLDGDGDPFPSAWGKVCEALHTQHGLDCNDDHQVLRVSTAQHIQITNGKMSKYVRIELRPIVGRLRGEASGNEHGQACRLAVERACDRATDGPACRVQALGCEPDPGDGTRWRCSPELVPAVAPTPSFFGPEPAPPAGEEI